MIEFNPQINRAMVPTTSLWEIVDKVGTKLDGHIWELKGSPRREKTEEKHSPEDMPYCTFRKVTTTRLELHYDYRMFESPFNSMQVIEKCVEHGIDDCQIQKLVLHFVEGKNDYKFYFVTRRASLRDGVGRYVKKVRERYKRKRKDAKKELQELRQLELDKVERNEARLPISEQTSQGFIEWLQKLTYGLVLLKTQEIRARRYFRDVKILDGVLQEEEVEEKDE